MINLYIEVKEMKNKKNQIPFVFSYQFVVSEFIRAKYSSISFCTFSCKAKWKTENQMFRKSAESRLS